MIEMNGLSLNENPKSPKECIKQAINTISIFKKKRKEKKEKYQTKTSYCNYRNTQEFLNTLNNMGSDMTEFAKRYHEQ